MESGGQPGNTNAVKGKRWRDAIDRALSLRCKSDGIDALTDLAERFLMECDEGEMPAFKELGDRLDGKAQQSIQLGNDPDNPLTQVTIVHE